MSTHSGNIARRAVVLPQAPQEYDVREEQDFRRSVEQQLQQIFALIAEIKTELEAL